MLATIFKDTHGRQHHLAFDDQAAVPGHIPADADRSPFKLVSPMPDGSFQLLDRDGNQTIFDEQGRLTRVAKSPQPV